MHVDRYGRMVDAKGQVYTTWTPQEQQEPLQKEEPQKKEPQKQQGKKPWPTHYMGHPLATPEQAAEIVARTKAWFPLAPEARPSDFKTPSGAFALDGTLDLGTILNAPYHSRHPPLLPPGQPVGPIELLRQVKIMPKAPPEADERPPLVHLPPEDELNDRVYRPLGGEFVLEGVWPTGDKLGGEWVLNQDDLHLYEGPVGGVGVALPAGGEDLVGGGGDSDSDDSLWN